jgi:hypothetical protein
VRRGNEAQRNDLAERSPSRPPGGEAYTVLLGDVKPAPKPPVTDGGQCRFLSSPFLIFLKYFSYVFYFKIFLVHYILKNYYSVLHDYYVFSPDRCPYIFIFWRLKYFTRL